MDIFSTSVRMVKGVGPKRLTDLSRAGVRTVYDFLTYYPRGYQDRTRMKRIAELAPGSFAAVEGRVASVTFRRLPQGRSLLQVALKDGTGSLVAAWFNQPYLKGSFKKGSRVFLYGKARAAGRLLQMASPSFEILEGTGEEQPKGRGIIPLYPLSGGLTQGYVRKAMRSALEDHLENLEEPFPAPLLERRNLMPLREALREIHFPSSPGTLKSARRRIQYEEFFFLQFALALHRKWIRGERKPCAMEISKSLDSWIRSLFPFRFTQAQDRVIREIVQDMCGPYPMNRLLQGDVGSGKTAVAVYALLAAVRNGKQGAVMAPTEILAGQHYRLLERILRGKGVRVSILSGGLAPQERSRCVEKIRRGETHIVVGTHALIQEGVDFKNLGIAVVDEQQKFGVKQRAALKAKGWNPDFLIMTATPIPRTLSMAFFGDLDLSIIDEMPPGREPIKTYAVPPDRVKDAYRFIRKEVEKGAQVFFICPMVEGSEEQEGISAKETHKFLSSQVFPEIPMALLHGKMRSDEKEGIMRGFREGAFRILVSTVVVEVGVDVPSARVMVVEHAHRFGLAQLHQLRGRIGRAGGAAYCFLLAGTEAEMGFERLQILTRTHDGFKISEEDLRMRGPGDFIGVRQHGLPELKMADMARDFPVLLEAREDAFNAVENRSGLERESWEGLLKAVKRMLPHGVEFAGLG